MLSVDVDKKVYKFTPSNALILPKWDGDLTDRTLFDLADFLRSQLFLLFLTYYSFY